MLFPECTVRMVRKDTAHSIKLPNRLPCRNGKPPPAGDTLFRRCKPLWNSTSVRHPFLALKTVTRRKKTGASLTVARDASENALPNFFRVNVHSLSPKGNHGSRLFAVRLLAVRLYRGPRKESKFNDGRQSQERWDRIASFATLDTRNFTTTFAGISMEVLLRGLIPLRCLW